MSHFYWETAPRHVVPTTNGPVRGLVLDGMHRFLGIPYAAPPIGELRWRPPAGAPGWRLPRDAYAYGPVCAQNNVCFPGFGFSSASEDCLYLNVHAPADADESTRLPVMVWIPGGGLFMGGSNDYDPSALVRAGPVVFVSLNYRLNVFGFFSHPAINAEDHEIGNYGLMDQQAALRWVRDNIAAFGGDPDNVTIFGQSAGGMSVWCHLVSPGSGGLFHKAIVQSGTALPLVHRPTTREVEQTGLDLVRDAGATGHSAAELRSLPTTDLLGANLMPEGNFGVGRYEIGQTVDGVVVPEPIAGLLSGGRFSRVPVINGTTRTEFHWFQAMMELSTGRAIPAAAYVPVLTQVLAGLGGTLRGHPVDPARIDDIVAAYPLDAFGSASEALSTAISDSGCIGVGNRQANQMLRRHLDAVYAYEFDVPAAPVSWPAVSFPYSSAHGNDLQYLFPGFSGGSGAPTALESDDDRALAEAMVGYWTTFAHHGDPNGGPTPRPTWNPYDPMRDNVMLLTPPTPREIEDFGGAHHSALWEDVAKRPG